jgi:hypothetical protein
LDYMAGVAALFTEPSEGRTDPRRWGGPRIAFELGSERGHGPLFPRDPHEVDLDKVLEARRSGTGRLLLGLLKKKNLHGGERRLLRALRWLGRSHRAPNEETAYLHSLIAFEALLKGDNEQGVAKGLGLRYAQLRGKTRAARRNLLGAVGELYDTRSAIVHARETGVTLGELMELWGILNMTVAAFLSRGFHRRSDDEIAAWFQDQSL